MASDFSWNKEKLFESIGYNPHEWQQKLHNSKAKIKIFRSGRRGGKSIGGAMDGFLELKPGARVWIVAPTYSLGEKEWRYIVDALFGGALFPNSKFLKKIFKKEKFVYNVTQGQMHLKGTWIHDPTQTPFEVLVKSFDKPQGLLGEELDYVICSEGAQMPLEIWERYLRPCLTTRNGTVIFPTTSFDNSELLDSLFARGQDKKDPFVESWEFPAFDNPYWAPNIEAEKDRLKKELSKEAYEEQVLGKKVYYSGRYYKEFDLDVHVKDCDFILGKTVYRGWDFGYRHPCIGWFQFNEFDQLCWLYTYLGTKIDDLSLGMLGKYLSGELQSVGQRLDVLEVIQKEGLTSFFPRHKEIDFQDFCDPSGVQQRSAAPELTSIRVLQSLGINPIYTHERTQKDTREPESIQIIRNLLKIRDDGRPNMVIDSQNTIAIEMFRQLTYERKMDGSYTGKYKKEGYHEHSHDVLRYVVKHIAKHVLYQKRRISREISYAYV